MTESPQRRRDKQNYESLNRQLLNPENDKEKQKRKKTGWLVIF